VLVPETNFNRTTRAKKRRVAVFGSTGSIGTSGLEVIAQNPDHFEVFALAAGNNTEKLAEQVKLFKPRFAIIGNETKYQNLKSRLVNCDSQTELLAGSKALAEVAAHPEMDVLLAAVVGFQGLETVLAAISADKHIALANKESLVAAGALIKRMMVGSKATIVPVDSEHSALFQVLQGENPRTLSRLILTASGGPFLHATAAELADITPAQAARHPKWSMGQKISIDSATLMNKALELIEAFWLFDCESDKLDVLVHPQSIVHSIAEFVDGTQLAQLSVPDMKGPIAYGLNYPDDRLPRVMSVLRLEEQGRLDFLPLDNEKFPAVQMARDALRCGGACPAVFNMANEVAVDLFIQKRIGFSGIIPLVRSSLEKYSDCTYESQHDLQSLMQEVREELFSSTY